MKFQYVQNLDSDEPIMLINKHIGYDEADGLGIDGSLFQQELIALDELGKKRIQIWINSVGGIVMDGYNICNAILKSKTRVDTYCMGLAASIAGVIFQTGRKRVMSDYGILMYHNPYGGDNNPMLDSMKNSLNKIISQRSGMDEDAVHRMMDRETFIEADEAIKMNLCDEIEETEGLNRKNFTGIKSHWQNANKILNKILIKENKMVKVANKLGLNPESSEDAILDEITKIINKKNDLEVDKTKNDSELDKLKNDMDEAENKFKELKDKYEKCLNDLEDMKKKKAEADDEAETDKAKNFIAAYVRAGVIKNEEASIAEWVKKAKADQKAAKTMLDAIPVNKAAVKFEITPDQTNVEKYPTVGMAMAQISNKLEKK